MRNIRLLENLSKKIYLLTHNELDELFGVKRYKRQKKLNLLNMTEILKNICKNTLWKVADAYKDGNLDSIEKIETTIARAYRKRRGPGSDKNLKFIIME